MVVQEFYYKIKQTDTDSYEMAVTFQVTGDTFNNILRTVAQKTGQEVPENIGSFKLLDEHKPKAFAIMKYQFAHIMDKIKQQLSKEDKVALLTEEYKDVFYIKKFGNWEVSIVIKGVISFC